MSSVTLFTLFAILFTLFTFPSATPAADNPVFRICDGVGCGMGKCRVSGTSGFGYECECDPGWMQTAFTNASLPKFLPCIIPNCTLNSSCVEAGAPGPPEIEIPYTNATPFDICRLVNCGGGVCNQKPNRTTYACECNEEYTNLLNNTAFPCFKPCSLGSDCMGIISPQPNPISPPTPQPPPPITPVSPTPMSPPSINPLSPPITESPPPAPESPSPTPAPSLAGNVTNQAKSLRHEAFFNGVIVFAISITPWLYDI